MLLTVDISYILHQYMPDGLVVPSIVPTPIVIASLWTVQRVIRIFQGHCQILFFLVRALSSSYFLQFIHI